MPPKRPWRPPKATESHRMHERMEPQIALRLTRVVEGPVTGDPARRGRFWRVRAWGMLAMHLMPARRISRFAGAGGQTDRFGTGLVGPRGIATEYQD